MYFNIIFIIIINSKNAFKIIIFINNGIELYLLFFNERIRKI